MGLGSAGVGRGAGVGSLLLQFGDDEVRSLC